MNKIALTLTLGAWALLSPAWGAETAAKTLLLRPESRLWLTGDSTMHPYHSDASTLTVRIEVNADAAAPFSSGLRALEVTVPVAGLKSGKGGLDKNLWKTLKAAEHPEITFAMSRYEVISSTLIKVSGALSVAGKTKAIELEAAVEAAESGARVKGGEELLMSDFGIKPPTMFLGALKTADKVVVHFDLILDTDSRR